MLHYLNKHFPLSPLPASGRAIIQNVSRRSFLKGATGLEALESPEAPISLGAVSLIRDELEESIRVV